MIEISFKKMTKRTNINNRDNLLRYALDEIDRILLDEVSQPSGIAEFYTPEYLEARCNTHKYHGICFSKTRSSRVET